MLNKKVFSSIEKTFLVCTEAGTTAVLGLGDKRCKKSRQSRRPELPGQVAAWVLTVCFLPVRGMADDPPRQLKVQSRRRL